MDGAGKTFVSNLVDALWYIACVFEKQGCKLPDFVSSFVVHNTPKTSKHRKRSVVNISGLGLSSNASSLYGCCSPCIVEGPNLLSWNQQFNSFLATWHSMETMYSHKITVWSKLMHYQLRLVSYLILCLLISLKNLPWTFSVLVTFPAL